MNRIETRTAYISLIEKGIVRVKFKPNVKLDKNDIIENLNASVKFTGGQHGALLEVNTNASITEQGLKFAESKQNAKYRIANALLIKSASVKLLWSFFNAFSKPKVRNAMFIDEKKAIQWLRTFLD